MGFNLADLFEAVADAIGDRTAVVCGESRATYRELDERSNRIAHHLAAAGIGPGDHVGMYMVNGLEYVESMLGCLKIRAVPINVNYRYVEAELRYLFEDADLAGLVFQREFAPRIESVRDGLEALRVFVAVEDGSGAGLERLGAAEYEAAVAAQSPARDFAPRSPDDLFIIYTGGTTGMPKGVMWRHEDIFFTGMGGGNPMGAPVSSAEELAANALARDPQIVQFPIPPLIHGAAQLGVFIGLHWGDKVVLIPKFDPDAVWEAVEAERVNTITIVGDAMARPMAEALAASEAKGTMRDVSSLVYVGSAGAVLSDAVKAQLQAMLPTCIVTENFGATETGHQGMALSGVPRPEGGGMRFMMKDTTTVLDEQRTPIVPGSGVVGKLAIRGRVPLGYYKDPVKTAETFLEIDGERWALPGDLATIDGDGTVIVFGRGAVCINSGGEKIFPEEVEAAVRAHPDVYDAVVVGVPDERWGERVAAVVQPRDGRTVTLEDLTSHCREILAGYKVPRLLTIVDEIARQPSGKPDFPWAKRIAAAAK